MRLVEAMTMCGLTGDTWAAWRAVAKCLDGEGARLTRDEQRVFEAATGRTRPPTEPPAEAYFVCGRRAGKSRFVGAAATRAASRGYALAPGERAVVALSSADRAQARVLFQYVSHPFEATGSGLAASLRALTDLVVRRTRWEVNLATGVSIEVHTSHFGRIRGRTFALACADELAFWASEDGSNPGSEVLAAIRPGLVTLGGQFIVISSPYAKSGPPFDAYDRYYGRDDARVLVWRAPSRAMNPTIPERIVLDALERDEASARAEWLGEFRDDVTGLLTRDALARVVVPGRASLPRLPDVDYLGFCDVSTGSGADSMTLSICHGEEAEDGRVLVVVDAIEEVRPPFDPHAVARAFAARLAGYGVASVTGDRFAQGWVASAFEASGARVPSELTRSELYAAFLVLVNAGLVELPDDARLVAQLTALQRWPGS